MSVEPEIIFDLRDGIAEVTLNRPQALNALTLNMVRILDSQLAAWGDGRCGVRRRRPRGRG